MINIIWTIKYNQIKEELLNLKCKIQNKNKWVKHSLIPRHIPPKYDIFGCIKPKKNYSIQVNILTQKKEIKIPWKDKDSI